MTAALLSGLGFGLGAWMLVRGLWPPRPTLAARLAAQPQSPDARAGAIETAAGDALEGASELELAAGRAFLAVLDALELPLRSLRRDLAITGRTLEVHAARKLFAMVSGLLLVAVGNVAATVAGLSLPPPVSALAGVALAVAGFVQPDLALRQEAARRREEFREVVGVFLDLVSVALAGGAGIEEAMTTTAGGGQGWAFARLRDALGHARLAGEPPWWAFGRLGEELDLAELRELAASLALAGREGAKIRASLAAKAEALRRRRTAESQAAAARVTEQLVLPAGLLLLGFVMFLGFPAVMRLLGG